MKEDRLRIKIYYEDTDCGGVVYYANYLRYFERARTEYFESRGFVLRKLMENGISFVVSEASLKYLAAARYGDILTVHTCVEKTGPASIVFRHSVTEGDEGKTLVEASVKIACIGADMRPMKLRKDLRDAIDRPNWQG